MAIRRLVLGSAAVLVRCCRHDAPSLGFLLLCTLFLFKDALLRGIVFYGPDSSHYYQILAWVKAMLGQGTMPLWAPQVFGGYPLFAAGEASVLYPPNLALFGLLPAARAFAWLGVVQFFLAGACTYAFIRVLHLGRLPALAGALTVAFGSFTVAHMHDPSVLNTATWLPVVLLFAELALRDEGWARLRDIALGGMAFALSLLGADAQMALLVAAALVAYVLFSRSFAASNLAIPGGMLAAGAALAAVQVLPLVELTLSRSEPGASLSGPASGPALQGSLVPLLPYLVGGSRAGEALASIGSGTVLYAGFLPLVLAAFAVALVRDRRTLLFALLGLAGLALALVGPDPGVSGGLLPAPGRAAYFFVFGIAVLAALGTAALRSHFRRGTTGRPRGLLALLAWATGTPVGARIWQTGLVLLVAIDLLSFAGSFYPQVPLTELSSLKPLDRFLAIHKGLHRAYVQPDAADSLPGRPVAFELPAVDSWRHAGERQEDFLALLRGSQARLLDLANVRYVIAPRAGRPPGPSEEYRAVFEDEDSVVYEKSQYLPRAFVVRQAVVVDSAASARREIASPRFDPTRQVILERAEAAPVPPPSAERGAEAAENGRAKIVAYNPTEVAIQARAGAASHLVVSDSYYPGWQATVDGQPATIDRANYLFRAVGLTPGRHTIVFRYEPLSFIIGAVVSAAAALLLAIGLPGTYWLVRLRARRRSAAPRAACVGTAGD